VARYAAATLGGCAVLALGLGLLLRLPVLVAPAAALLGAAYAVTRAVDGGTPDRQAPVVGVALLLVCELGYWAHELRTTSPDEPGARAPHLAWLALLAVAVFLPGVALLTVADLLRVEGIAVEALGAAAVAAIAGLVLLASPSRARAE
jgi:hypothetical protein